MFSKFRSCISNVHCNRDQQKCLFFLIFYSSSCYRFCIVHQERRTCGMQYPQYRLTECTPLNKLVLWCSFGNRGSTVYACSCVKLLLIGLEYYLKTPFKCICILPDYLPKSPHPSIYLPIQGMLNRTSVAILTRNTTKSTHSSTQVPCFTP